MSREIKFEYGFQSVNGIVKKVYTLSEIPEIKEKCDVLGHLPIVYVRQYTGLKSFNKKKHLEDIYEGDIFRSLDEDEREMYSVVMWIQQRAAFYMVPADHYKVILYNDVSEEEDFNWLFNEANLYDFSIDCGLTKVGNVFETPELLEQ